MATHHSSGIRLLATGVLVLIAARASGLQQVQYATPISPPANLNTRLRSPAITPQAAVASQHLFQPLTSRFGLPVTGDFIFTDSEASSLVLDPDRFGLDSVLRADINLFSTMYSGDQLRLPSTIDFRNISTSLVNSRHTRVERIEVGTPGAPSVAAALLSGPARVVLGGDLPEAAALLGTAAAAGSVPDGRSFAAPVVTPEPGTLALLGFGSLVLLRRPGR